MVTWIVKENEGREGREERKRFLYDYCLVRREGKGRGGEGRGRKIEMFGL